MPQLIDRLKLIMERRELTPAAFAEKLEIQRSGLSHILNGRNKPSLDFVLKLLTAFPDVDAYWLLTGRSKPVVAPDFWSAGSADQAPPEIHQAFESEDPVPYNSDTAAANKLKPRKERAAIDRIVIFYTDRTFEQYNSQI